MEADDGWEYFLMIESISMGSILILVEFKQINNSLSLRLLIIPMSETTIKFEFKQVWFQRWIHGNSWI